AAARRRRIPLLLHNGRLSHARLGAYRLLFAVTGNLLAGFRVLLMRDEAEAARRLGASEKQIQVTGNTKFDNLVTQPPSEAVSNLRARFGLTDAQLVW